MDLFKPKCVFCGQKKGFFHSVHKYGIYGSDLGKRYYYHPECFRLVENEPEKFGHIMLDMVLHLAELERACKEKENSKIAKIFKEKVEQCQENSFKRMLPGR